MWELDCKESLVLKNWCFWTVVLEKTLESPLDCKEIKPVHPRDQSRIFIERTDAETTAPILWPPDTKNWLTGKDPNAGKDWMQEEKGRTDDEMAWWHYLLDGHEFEQVLGVDDGQGNLACCNPWGCKELDLTVPRNVPTGWFQILKPAKGQPVLFFNLDIISSLVPKCFSGYHCFVGVLNIFSPQF